MPNLETYSLPINLLIFTAAACAVWLSGTKIAAYADELAKRFDLSHALLGLFMLAGVTSLPEIATSFSAAGNGNAALAVNNLLGAIALQIAVLAVADMVFSSRALTSVSPNPVVMLQGALNVCLLAFVAIAVIVGDVPFLGAGACSWGVFAVCLYSFIKAGEVEKRHPWIVNNPDDPALDTEGKHDKKEHAQPLQHDSLAWLCTKAFISAMVILLGGYIVATVGDVVAQQSGLGEAFVGIALMAVVTSLPEASTVFACVRRGLYTMAISDILGTTTFNVALLLGVDAIAPGAPVLTQVGDFSAVGALLGLIVTGLFLVGLIERADRTIFRMGLDSAAILAVYSGGMVLLYTMRESP